jgi:DNA (cytosine-5)-methyltransferase 1
MRVHASVFTGLGGFDIASDCMGWETLFNCEWDKFCRRILKFYWPHVKSYEDIDDADFTIHRGLVDVLSGGFPCQPYSTAGKRKGKADARHKWPQMLRAIREIQPGYVVGENVYGLINWNRGMVFHEVQTDLENEGYQVAPIILPAAGVNAPHFRERIFFVAYSASNGLELRRSRKDRCAASQSQSEESERQRLRSNVGGTSSKGYAANGSEQGLQNGFGPGLGADAKKNGAGMDAELKRYAGNEHASDTTGSRRIQGNGGAIAGKYNKSYSGDATDAHGQGLPFGVQGRVAGHAGEAGAFAGGEFARNDSAQNWQEFPTQSPICSRNDGLSRKLDGITFPSWRRQSIRAFGNAVVPQVAFQIYQAI